MKQSTQNSVGPTRKAPVVYKTVSPVKPLPTGNDLTLVNR
jgi:hypothetical protein